MKKYHLVIVAAILATACAEASKEMFRANAAIHFKMPAGDTTLITRGDTIIYSFAFDPVATRREICIPVELIGFAADRDRTYRVLLTPDTNTREGDHHLPVNPLQTLPAGKTTDSLRVTFLRAPDMQQSVRKIHLAIRDGGDLAAGTRERLTVTIQVSDILQRPAWWNEWWNEYFGGAYDPQIYRAWMNIWGGAGDLTAYPYPGWWYAPQVLTALIDLKAYFDQHETYYINNPTVRIIIPYPN
ncbi:MAG: DUF4843 domain-containing protein [Odoribacteraceae bacterium]|jgi:hypothetical protein|nr:DUF4843 domain-containing protein [Odoribacteraceae bacterium]